jgi:hypothetical protein
MLEIAMLKGTHPVFSGHETFPVRYGWLKKVFDSCLVEEEKEKPIKELFNREDAIVIFGVGKNMVSSMKYWGIYTSLLDTESDKKLSINKYARKIFSDDGYDPWMENYATLWYIHWNLATIKKNCLFTYLWFFNCWNGTSFDKESLFLRIKEAINNHGLNLPSDTTLKRDIECFLGVYSIKSGKKLNEESIESPLTELELISPVTRRDVFQINRGIKPNLSIETFLFGLFMFWGYYSPNLKSLSFESICYELMSPGRIFLINEDAVAEYMLEISNVTNGMLEYTETAGMRQILLNKEITNFRTIAYTYLFRNYQ